MCLLFIAVTVVDRIWFVNDSLFFLALSLCPTIISYTNSPNTYIHTCIPFSIEHVQYTIHMKRFEHNRNWDCIAIVGLSCYLAVVADENVFYSSALKLPHKKATSLTHTVCYFLFFFFKYIRSFVVLLLILILIPSL